MQVNLSTWGYYKPGFVDPLYVPYQRKTIRGKSINTWKKQGASPIVDPGQVRAGLGIAYQRQYPQYDACGLGWKPGPDGYCVAEEPEFEGTFYTKDAHVPKYQYHDGYTVKPKGARRVSQFDNKSVNPFTGEYQISHTPYPSPTRSKYGQLPSRDSLLG